MNSKQSRHTAGSPVVPIAEHVYWPCCRNGPKGLPRPVVGAHSPFFNGAGIHLPLTYILKVIEPVSRRVVSSTRMSCPEEASAALKLLGPTRLQPVLVGRSSVRFFSRTDLS
jgi:hypothetical protein